MFNKRTVSHNVVRKCVSGVLAMLLIVVGAATMVSAASYVKTTLQELTNRAVAVVEVEVVDRNYPPMGNATFPRTHVSVKVHRTLKGTLPENFVIDIPGGIDGNVVSHVPDGPDFRRGERSIVFVKQPSPGLYMVQDLGLGKFNIVERAEGKFVESPICPKAVAGKVAEQKDLEANLLTRSIPYDTFCKLVTSYAAGKPAEDAARLAAVLGSSGSHEQNLAPAVVHDYNDMQRAARARQTTLISVAVLAFMVLAVALWVRHRRRTNAKALSTRTIATLMAGALVAGVIGAGSTHAFVQFEQKTIWNLDKAVAGKVADNRIIWKASTSVSATNANVMTGVQGAFNKWEAVNASRLAFTNGGSTSAAVNNSKDAENIVAWSATPTNDFSSSTLAICFSSFTVGSSSNFLDGDIIFNDRDFSWAAGADGNVASVALHEIGHFIGLNHTTQNGTVMFPFDGGLTSLSADEITAAQTMYPGAADAAPPPPPVDPGSPTAAVSASPTSGNAPLAVSFDAGGSTLAPSGALIASIEWTFGDGGTATGAQVSHTYNSLGTFTATVKVTDTNGEDSIASVEISVGKPVEVQKASFKLNFKSLGKDGFSAVIVSEKLVGIKAPKGAGQILEGSMLIGDQEWLFDFDTAKLKSIQFGGPQIKVNDKTGVATLTVKNADLRDVLGGHGAVNDNVSGASINVPLTIWFGEGSNMYLFGVVGFNYSAQLDKAGTGKR